MLVFAVWTAIRTFLLQKAFDFKISRHADVHDPRLPDAVLSILSIRKARIVQVQPVELLRRQEVLQRSQAGMADRYHAGFVQD